MSAKLARVRVQSNGWCVGLVLLFTCVSVLFFWFGLLLVPILFLLIPMFNIMACSHCGTRLYEKRAMVCGSCGSQFRLTAEQVEAKRQRRSATTRYARQRQRSAERGHRQREKTEIKANRTTAEKQHDSTMMAIWVAGLGAIMFALFFVWVKNQ